MKTIDREIEISSWDQFVHYADLLDVGTPTQSNYVYRGHADATWRLSPTLLRESRRLNHSEADALEIEKQCLIEFKSQAHLHISPNVLSTTPDTISWWTLMQHHGAPTRLLDWCNSIYVAAYFATIEHPDTPGGIWLVHTRSLKDFMEKHYNEEGIPKTQDEISEGFLEIDSPRSLIICHRMSKTDRMVAQQGEFTISRNILADHGTILEEAFREPSGKDLLFMKIVIPSNLKGLFLRKLRSMNITASTLFPGLDGLGRSVSELVRAHD